MAEQPQENPSEENLEEKLRIVQFTPGNSSEGLPIIIEDKFANGLKFMDIRSYTITPAVLGNPDTYIKNQVETYGNDS